MKPAQARVHEVRETLSLSEPKYRVISNQDGTIVQSSDELLNRIVSQIANPVRWDLCMQTMKQEGVTGLIELFPSGTLTGIAKRALPEIETFGITTPETLSDAVEFAQRHSRGAA